MENVLEKQMVSYFTQLNEHQKKICHSNAKGFFKWQSGK